MQAKEKEAVKAGKGLFFPKRSEKKRQQLIARYQELKATGRLEKVMAKRRKKERRQGPQICPRGAAAARCLTCRLARL